MIFKVNACSKRILRGVVHACLSLVLFSGYLSAGSLVVIASYATSVEDQEDGAKKNIFLSCRKIHGYVLAPREVFSFNEIVGEGSSRNGFANGRVLYRDEIVYEPGGGLCQMSSTLYNAFLMAGLAVLERHRHYQPVSYVPLGLDATIRYGKKDLRVRNPYDQKICIEASMSEKSLLVVLKAEHPLPFRYELDTEEEEVGLPSSGEESRVRKGITVYVYRKKYSGKKLLESFLLYRDFYPPVLLR